MNGQDVMLAVLLVLSVGTAVLSAVLLIRQNALLRRQNEDDRRRQALVGRRVLVTPRSGAPRAALALGIDDECRMIVRYDGESRPAAVTSGEAGVRLL